MAFPPGRSELLSQLFSELGADTRGAGAKTRILRAQSVRMTWLAFGARADQRVEKCPVTHLRTAWQMACERVSFAAPSMSVVHMKRGPSLGFGPIRYQLTMI
jgi:hypothetical protein